MYVSGARRWILSMSKRIAATCQSLRLSRKWPRRFSASKKPISPPDKDREGERRQLTPPPMFHPPAVSAGADGRGHGRTAPPMVHLLPREARPAIFFRL